jgi:hypothetical protein
MKGQIIQPDYEDFWQINPQLNQYQELDSFIAQEQATLLKRGFFF